jgi:type I restriction enzyme S subunit
MGSDWVVRRIGDFAWDVNERASDGVLEVLSVTKHAGFMASLEFFGKQVFSKDTSNYKIVRRGQFAYATIHLDEGSVDCLNIRDAGIISPMYTVFDVDEAVVDRRYMLELLKSPGMLQRYAAIGAGSVNRRRSISFDTLAAEELRLPPLAEQKKIAQILSSVDEAIEATQAVIDQTRRVKEAMLQTLLTRGLGHTRFKQTEIGEIPEAWEVRRLGELVTLHNGRAYAQHEMLSAGPWKLIRIQNLKGGDSWYYSNMNLPAHQYCHPGDLLFAWSASFGPFWWRDEKAIYHYTSPSSS